MTRWTAPRALVLGVAGAARRPRLVAGLWLWQLVIAAATTLPVFQWLRDRTAYRPTVDRLLDRFSISDFVDIARTSGGSPVATWNAGLAGAMLLTIATAPIVLAVTVAALRNPDDDTSSVVRAPAECYWRLLLLTVLGRGVALVAAGLAALAVSIALGTVRDRTDWSLPVVAAVVALGAACVLSWLWAAVDVGACAVVRGRVRGALGAWLIGLRTVWRMPAFTLILWAGFGLALFVSLLILAAGTASLPLTTLPLILLMAALHQSFAVWRVMLRVGVLSAELTAWDGMWPLPTPPAVLAAPDEDPASVHDEQDPGPRQDREREVDDREAGEKPME